MGSNRLLIVSTALGLLASLGCDRRSAEIAKAAADAAKPAATQEVKPTTQALLTGKTRKLALPGGPLSAVVPESWKLDTDGPVIFLTGPSLAGAATIGLSSPSSLTFKQPEIDALIAKLSAEASTYPESFRRATLRTIGNVQVVERRYLKKPITRDKTDAKGAPIPNAEGGFETVTATPVQWTLTFFVPAAQDFSRYELNLIDLETDQLVVDEPLLDKVIKSVAVESSAPASAATTAP